MNGSILSTTWLLHLVSWKYFLLQYSNLVISYDGILYNTGVRVLECWIHIWGNISQCVILVKFHHHGLGLGKCFKAFVCVGDIQGVLHKHCEMLIQCDMRLKCLSQQPKIVCMCGLF